MTRGKIKLSLRLERCLHFHGHVLVSVNQMELPEDTLAQVEGGGEVIHGETELAETLKAQRRVFEGIVD